jgi:hypothetical protein
MPVTSNQAGVKPLLINGRPVKAINQFYNKRKAKLQARKAFRQIRDLTHKRISEDKRMKAATIVTLLKLM